MNEEQYLSRISQLENEIVYLHGLLDNAGISYKREAKELDDLSPDRNLTFEENQGARILPVTITKQHIQYYYGWFFDHMNNDKQNRYIIRNLRKSEICILKDFLYEAIFIPEGMKPLARDIVDKPELRVYTDDFGSRKGDNCLVADFGGKVVGAVWTRIMNDYGHVDDETPSFAISLYKEYRGKGIGSQLMVKMLELLKWQGYKKASLAVQKANYAVKMYKDVGFKTVDENDEEYIMVCGL